MICDSTQSNKAMSKEKKKGKEKKTEKEREKETKRKLSRRLETKVAQTSLSSRGSCFPSCITIHSDFPAISVK